MFSTKEIGVKMATGVVITVKKYRVPRGGKLT
jgi:hypothetical protein